MCLAGGTAMVIGGVLTGMFGLVVPGAIAAIGSVPPIWIIVLAVGFVIAGTALIVIGAATHRWDRVFVGALSCVFFGACAWIGRVRQGGGFRRVVATRSPSGGRSVA